jgi:hypothetical protein
MIHDYFDKEMPTYIYDPENNFKKLGYYLPELTNQYLLIDANTYKKINNSFYLLYFDVYPLQRQCQ